MREYNSNISDAVQEHKNSVHKHNWKPQTQKQD